MSVIPITVFFSLLLAGFFVVLFAREQRRHRFASAERESLLPLADETPRAAARTACVCPHSGEVLPARSPCAGCSQFHA